jgi:hypothetical protein
MTFNDQNPANIPAKHKWLTANKIIGAVLICYFLYLIIPVFYRQAVPKITEPHDVASCANITTEKEKDSCYYTVAGYLLDTSPCSNVTGEEMIFSCYNNVAMRKHDPSLCDPIKNIKYRDWCYRGSNEASLYNMKPADFFICPKIQDLDEKHYCYSDAIRDNQDFTCQKVTGIEKDICLVIAAEQKNDKSICGQIFDKTEKNKCNDLFTVNNQ